MNIFNQIRQLEAETIDSKTSEQYKAGALTVLGILRIKMEQAVNQQPKKEEKKEAPKKKAKKK